jgi:preprotein translocase SecF subunit
MNFNFKIVQNKKIFFIISAVIVALGIVSMIFRPFYLDVDFAGGTEITYSIKTEGFDAAKESTVINGLAREALSAIGSDSDLINNAIASDGEVIIRSKELNEYEIDAIDALLKEHYGDPVAPLRTIDEINKELEALNSETTETTETTDETVTDERVVDETTETTETVEETVVDETTETETEEVKAEELVKRVGMDSVGASVSKDLRDAAVLSTTIAVILMLVYITIRFQFSSAVAAVICLCHDVFIVLAAYSILQIPVSSSIIAVILTILGYSINATIVIFDRVRENVKRNQSNTFAENVNISVNQSLTRSINTTITTLLTIGLIYILGVQSIKEFALPLIIGIVAGLYSSVFLAGSLWASLKKKGNRVR